MTTMIRPLSTLADALRRFGDLDPVPEARCECGCVPLGGWDRDTCQCVTICPHCGKLDWDQDLFDEAHWLRPVRRLDLPARVDVEAARG